MPAKNRLIILGAGFSRPAGLPLAADLWTEIRATASNYPSDHRGSKFMDDLNDYLEFRKNADGKAMKPEEVDFEDFMRYLDVEHYLGLRGGDTWSGDGNEGTVVVKFLIGKILARHINALRNIPDLYLEFARRLETQDTIITFNYDTLLERALEAVGKPYRLFSTRLKSVGEFSGVVDTSREEVIVLKVHGSIDWFDRSNFEYLVARRREQRAPAPTDIIFSHEQALGLKCLTDGPRFEADPLKNIFRATNLEALYQKDLLFRATPRMLPPSGAKLLYSSRMNDFWDGMNSAGLFNLGFAVVGFSLPSQDEYARQIMHRLIRNYQGNNEPGRRKSPLTIVDFFADKESEGRFRERYRFVDWSKAELVGGGLDLASLDKIFA